MKPMPKRWVPYKLWETRDGRGLIIHDMETSHIENARNMLAREMGGHEIIYRMHLTAIGDIKPLVSRMKAEIKLQKAFRYILTFERELERRRGLEER